jgi:hypothetical protein
LNHPFQVAVGQAGNLISVNGTPGLLKPFSSRVHLMDYFLLDEKSALVRLRHVFAASEGAPYNQPETIDLSEYLPRRIASITETQVTGVQPPSYVDQRLRWTAEGEKAFAGTTYSRPQSHADASTLNPMQIRTFIVEFAE